MRPAARTSRVLDDRYIRIAVRPESEQTRLIAAFEGGMGGPPMRVSGGPPE